MSLVVSGEQLNYTDSWSDHGFTLVQSDQSGVRVIHSVNSFQWGQAIINDEAMTVIAMPGVMLPNDEGAPDLPGQGRYIAIPSGATARLNVIRMQTETFSDVSLAPAPRIPFEDDDSPLHYEKNMAIYGKDAFYPSEPVKLSQSARLRGVDVVMLGITPFQYNPVSRELVVIRDIEVEIIFEGGSSQFGEQRYRSRWWDPILADALLNFSSLPPVDYNNIHLGNHDSGDGCEYLIITPDGSDFVMWADSIATFRNKQGILTEVVTLTEVGGNTVSDIETFVDNAYNNWTVPPSAVLLLGDFGSSMSNNVIAPIYNNYCASDNIYADVDGDHLPEMAFARITANDAGQLETMVTKFLNHETNPPTNPDFYDNPITAVGWQTTRWFQICGETVGGYWKNELAKNPVRINDIYSGTPGTVWSTATNTSTVVDYFGPDGLGYIPASPSTLGGWTGGSATIINNTINNGSFIMLHRDHGSETGWGEPSYGNSSINGLQNTDLIFVMSVNCLTGKYNWSNECFTEKFHRYTYNGANSGALGLTAASEVSYSFVNDTYVWGSIDNMWPDFMPDYGTQFPHDFVMPAFGNAAGKIFLQQSSWPYNTSNKQVTYHLFHHHGDAFLTLYDEVPMNLTVNHMGHIIYGSAAFEMTADDGSFICLYYDGEIQATATGTGSLQSIPIPALPLGAMVSLTVTKQNYYRHEEQLQVVDPLTAGFEADLTLVCSQGSVNFTDQSLGFPTSWLWTFEGGTPATSTAQHPQGIVYGSTGTFDVTLEVTGLTSTDTYTRTDYIEVADNIALAATITASAEDVCESDTITFAVQASNAGIAPVYQWKRNGNNVGEGGDTYIVSGLTDSDIIECEVTSSYSCASPNPAMSNAIVMSVTPLAPVSVIIEADTTTICEGQQVIFTAIPENGGDAPLYQWKVNGEDAGTPHFQFVTTGLADGDTVTCVVTSNAYCVSGNPATSNEMIMTVLEELAVAVSIETGSTDICEGDEATFTAIAENGGEDPVYQWMVNGENVGENSNTYTTTELQDGDEVTCELTSTYGCAINNPAISLPVAMTVSPYPGNLDLPFGPSYVNLYQTQTSTYTTSIDPNTVDYIWAVTPEEAWTELLVDSNHLTVLWSLDFTGQVVINVNGLNDCGEGPVSEDKIVTVDYVTGLPEDAGDFGISIFPNPNNGSFTLKLSSIKSMDVKLRIRNSLGENVFSDENLKLDGKYQQVIDLGNEADGIYFLILETNRQIYTEKIVIQH
jgi:PKD repeat protein